VQRTIFQLVHCRHFENGGKVVCVSADFLRAHHLSDKNSYDERGERGRLLLPVLEKKKKIPPALGEFNLVFHIKKYTEKFVLIYVYSLTRNEKKR